MVPDHAVANFRKENDIKDDHRPRGNAMDPFFELQIEYEGGASADPLPPISLW